MSVSAAHVMPLGPDVAGQRYGVLGLARSGRATVTALIAAGAQVTAWDDRADARDAAAADGADIADLTHGSLNGMTAVVVSPGVPINQHAVADAARATQVPIIGDIELFALARPHLPRHQVVGITGTNGKSTTTALIHHLLVSAGQQARLGGNIGRPILGEPPLEAGGTYVLELSSYQIDLTHSLSCDIAVLTNITPDHLDRYDGDFMAYAASKGRLFAMQHGDQLSVIATDDDRCRALAGRISHRLLRVSAGDIDPEEQAGWPALQGPHNAQNAACAIAVARALNVSEERIQAGLASFPGLPHRMEHVASHRGVLFINDSKATNPASSAPALAAWPPAGGRARIHWIAGGLAKGDGVGECAPFLSHVAHAWLIGDAATMLAETLDGTVAWTDVGTLDHAVAAAADAALPGDVVLLSPAAASFDQFTDFEQRGDRFRSCVAAWAADQGGTG